MKNLFWSATTIALILFVVYACKKEATFASQTDRNNIVQERSGEGHTILGSKRTIPYKVDVIKQAYNNLNDPDISTLLPNYLYVRFLPQNPQDVKALLESGFEFYDYPLDYDISYRGEKYHDPSITDETYTWQYAVIKYNDAIPPVQHEILEPLALVSEDCQLAQEAFRLTDNAYQAPGTFDPDPPIVAGRFGEIHPQGDPGGSTGGGSTGGGTPPSGDCGCPLPDHTRKPSGCVQVQDNMLGGFEGVKKVEVMVSKSNLFGRIFHRKTETDFNGCWEIDHEYHGTIHVWVRWENGNCDIRTMDGNLDLWGYAFPRRAEIGAFSGPFFNNIPIRFNYTTPIDSKGFRNWVASTANNSVFEFGGYTSSNGILGALPTDISIVVTPWGNGGNSGAAPMLDQMGLLPQFLLSAAGIAILKGVFNILYTPASVPAVPIAVWLEVFAPDIAFNLNNGGQVNSDDIRELAYHELSHALHYAKVGDTYWLQNMAYVILHGGYGDGSENGAGRCSVIESWGFETGRIAAHLRYGSSNSNGGDPTANTWRAILESDLGWTLDEETGLVHIPWGWLWDVQDNNLTNPGNETENPIVTNAGGDAVWGITNAQIFSVMDPSMTSMSEMKSALIPFLPQGVTTAQYNSLSNAYGF
jgi:hypothetical protein